MAGCRICGRDSNCIPDVWKLYECRVCFMELMMSNDGTLTPEERSRETARHFSDLIPDEENRKVFG